MKAVQREIYSILSGSYGLCCFCKYGVSMGCDVGTECKHPLEAARDREMDDQLDDCWAFRPRYTVPEMADIHGEILIHDWSVISLDRNESGMILIKGSCEL